MHCNGHISIIGRNKKKVMSDISEVMHAYWMFNTLYSRLLHNYDALIISLNKLFLSIYWINYQNALPNMLTLWTGCITNIFLCKMTWIIHCNEQVPKLRRNKKVLGVLSIFLKLCTHTEFKNLYNFIYISTFIWDLVWNGWFCNSLAFWKVMVQFINWLST